MLICFFCDHVSNPVYVHIVSLSRKYLSINIIVHNKPVGPVCWRGCKSLNQTATCVSDFIIFKCRLKTDSELHHVLGLLLLNLFESLIKNSLSRAAAGGEQQPASSSRLSSAPLQLLRDHQLCSRHIIFPQILYLLAINVHLLQSAGWFTPITWVYAPQRMIRLCEMNQ